MPKMEACVYLSCNMRSRGCAEPESSISTKDSRSPPPETLLGGDAAARTGKESLAFTSRPWTHHDWWRCPSLRRSGRWMRRKLGNHITRADYARFWKYCRFTTSVGFIIHLIISLACLSLLMRAGVRFFSVQVWKMTEMKWEASTNWFTLITETKLTRLKYCWNRRKYLIILNDITKEFRHVWTRLTFPSKSELYMHLRSTLLISPPANCLCLTLKLVL